MREPDASTAAEINWGAAWHGREPGLDDGQVRALASAWALAPTEAGETLSEFEREILTELGRRYLESGRAMVITAAEQAVLDDVLKALTASARGAWRPEIRDGVVIGLRPASSQEAA